MKRALGFVTVLVLAAIGVAWWLWPEGSTTTSEPSAEVPPAPGFVRAAQPESVDAGVGRLRGLVLDVDGRPVPNARVRLYGAADLARLECSVCREELFSCADPATVRQVIDAVRARSLPLPTPIAEVITGADGSWDLGERPLLGELYAVAGSASTLVTMAGAAVEELVLEPRPRAEVTVVDASDQPLAGVETWLFSPREGTLTAARTNAEGVVSLESPDPDAWVFAEQTGLLPAGRLLEESVRLVLSAPHTLVIRTKLGPAPVDAEVTVPLHGGDRKLRTTNGVLRLEQLPQAFYVVNVATDDYSAPAQVTELVEPVVELEFQLRKSAKLVVSLLTSAGDPIEAPVIGSLMGEGANVDATAEHGALLVLGPVAEGEYTLTVTSEGMVPITRTLDLHAGENALELLLRSAPKLAGRVSLPDGRPASEVRVSVLEEEQEVATSLTAEDGKFEVEVMYPGRFLVRAEAPRHGVGEAMAQVPGPPVAIQLDAKGALEVVVVDEDGSKLPADLLVRAANARFVRWVEDEDLVARVAGLPGGAYVIEKSLPDRIPIEQPVEVSEGRTTRVTLQARAGAKLSGRVVDHGGKPVSEAAVMSGARSDSVQTDAEGRFELKGLKPGKTELFAVSQQGAQTERLEVTAPAADVVLRLPEIVRVRGRVVDERGAPVPQFDANGTSVTSADGKFEVDAPNKSLDVWREGYAPLFITPAEGDVGELVLKKQPMIEGEVVDGEGRPVGGATVMASTELVGVTTDGQGRFSLVVTSEDKQELLATRGSSSGRVPLVLGQRARIVLRKGTTIVGRVVDATGKGVQTLVRATSATTSTSQEVDTDEAGRFQLELPHGVWLFATRANRLTRSVEVAGERLELTLGEQAQCGAIVRSSKLIDGLWFLPGKSEGGPWEVMTHTAGAFEYPVMTPALEVSVRGVPCGRYTLAASIENIVSETPLDLQSPGQAVFVEPSPVLLTPEEPARAPTEERAP
ncbi:MAG: carboxypeptidase regulatory-like domain-containing protein [Myxococcota bacterium]